MHAIAKIAIIRRGVISLMLGEVKSMLVDRIPEIVDHYLKIMNLHCDMYDLEDNPYTTFIYIVIIIIILIVIFCRKSKAKSVTHKTHNPW